MLENNKSNSSFSTKPEFKDLSAVKNDKIINIDMGRYLTFGPSFLENSLDLINTINVEKK